MLGKLFKYEFKSTARWMVPAYIFIFAMTIINMFTLSSYSSNFAESCGTGNIMFDIVRQILAFVYFAAIAVICFATFVVVVYRFYKNMLSSEGYISLTLPVSVDEHLVVKIITSMVWMLLSVIVVAISTFALMSSEISFFEMFKAISTMMRFISDFTGKSSVLYITLFFALVLTTVLQTVTMAYLSFSLGQLSNKNKIGMAVVAYIGINFALQIFGSIFMAKFIANLITSSDFNMLVNYLISFGGVVVIFNIALATIFYFGTRYILINKINLQ